MDPIIVQAKCHLPHWGVREGNLISYAPWDRIAPFVESHRLPGLPVEQILEELARHRLIQSPPQSLLEAMLHRHGKRLPCLAPLWPERLPLLKVVE